MSKYLIKSLGIALIAAGESLCDSANAMPDVSGYQEVTPAVMGQDGAQIAPSTIANAELDAEGMPWDERIHASTKTKTAVGLWTKKKGVDDMTKAAVTKELRELYPAPQAAAPVAPAPAPVAPAIAMPTMAAPMAPTPYQELCAWLATNTGDGKVLSSQWVTDTFNASSTTLAALATADATLLKQWLDAFKAVLAGLPQMPQ